MPLCIQPWHSPAVTVRRRISVSLCGGGLDSKFLMHGNPYTGATMRYRDLEAEASSRYAPMTDILRCMTYKMRSVHERWKKEGIENEIIALSDDKPGIHVRCYNLVSAQCPLEMAIDLLQSPKIRILKPT